jgi:hypothetical protein
MTDQQPSAPLVNVNWEAIAAQIGLTLTGSLKDLITGTAEDIRTYGTAIARDMLGAVREPDVAKREALLSELKGQARSLAELNRIRLNNEAWAQFDRIFDVAAGVADRLLAGVILAL